jgi:DNA-binding transcriptional LysR family regulator
VRDAAAASARGTGCDSFRAADADFQPTVEVRYCNTACVLAATGVGVAVVDPFSPRQGGHDLVVRPFTPSTPVSAYVLWSEARPLSNMAKTFRSEVRNASLGFAGGVATIGAPSLAASTERG